jgi:hypothetical protein
MANTARAQYPATGQPINLPFIIVASSVGTLKRGLFTSWIQIFASAFGTVFEWHDIYLYATLTPRCREATKP